MIKQLISNLLEKRQTKKEWKKNNNLVKDHKETRTTERNHHCECDCLCDESCDCDCHNHSDESDLVNMKMDSMDRSYDGEPSPSYNEKEY
ncbi:MAG: hypothetical protein ACI840_001291 [Ulvibacter sp.]|jgi:hypothetical protein